MILFSRLTPIRRSLLPLNGLGNGLLLSVLHEQRCMIEDLQIVSSHLEMS